MLKLNSPLTNAEGIKLLNEHNLIGRNMIVTSESFVMLLDEEEITPDLLGVEDYSELNLHEGDEISVLTYELSDSNLLSIFYDHDYAYTAVLQDSSYDVIKVKEL